MDDAEKQEHIEVATRLLAEQNFPAAVIAGAVAAVLGAIAYGMFSPYLGQGYGFAIAAVGCFVGFAIGFLGRGIESRFGVLAGLCAIAGCLLGYVVRAMLTATPRSATSLMDVFGNKPISELVSDAGHYFYLIDLVYWFIAVFAAVFLAKRGLSREERLSLGTYERRR